MEKNSDALLTTTKIKKETQDETIKEYAESAMNELLAWYGYGSTHENSKLSSSCHSQHGSNSSEPESPKVLEECEWCGKHINDTNGLTSSKSTFCSELCFSQSRRANFKKNRTCDWCKHLRHTISYVDFQDGASQLQFCSDKCLNQYKMHIFCRETRAHLELHPHIPDSSDLGGSLITPELWLKNCKSPEHTTSSTQNSPREEDNTEQNSPLPLISPTHLIKSENMQSSKRRKFQRKHRRSSSILTQSSVRSSPISEAPQDLRVRQTPSLNKFEPIHLQKDYRINEFNEKFPQHTKNRFMGIPNGSPERHPKFLPFTVANDPHIPYTSKPSLENLMPPVTVLVPYPIIIPLPLPIPIPVPIPIGNYTDILDNKRNQEVASSATKNSNEITNLDKKSSDDIKNTKEKEELFAEDREILPKETTKNNDTPSKKKKCLAFQKNELRTVKKKKYSLS